MSTVMPTCHKEGLGPWKRCRLWDSGKATSVQQVQGTSGRIEVKAAGLRFKLVKQGGV